MKQVNGIVYRPDGRALRYRVFGGGGGGAPLVFLNGIVSGAESWLGLLERFSSSHRRLLVWDYMGQGLSSGPRRAKEISMKTFAEDCSLVMAGAGIEGAVVVAYRSGVDVMLELYRRHAHRVQAMISICGIYTKPFGPAAPSRLLRRLTAEIMEGCAPLAGVLWRPVRVMLRTQASGRAGDRGAVSPEKGGRHRGSPPGLLWSVSRMDPRVASRALISFYRNETASVVRRIRVPCLLIGGGRDRIVRPGRLEAVAGRIPGAECAIFPHCSHAAHIEAPEAVCDRIERFLQEHGL